MMNIITVHVLRVLQGCVLCLTCVLFYVYNIINLYYGRLIHQITVIQIREMFFECELIEH